MRYDHPMGKKYNSCVITIGNFDGVHRGHQVLIRQLVDFGRKMELPSVVYTFHPHPMKLLYPERQTERLFDLRDLQEQMKKLGVDDVYIQKFDTEFSLQTPEDFLQNEILLKYHPKVIVVGYDFGFGKNKEGNLAFLKDFCRKHEIILEIVSPVQDGLEIVSSSRIRQSLRVGDLTMTENLLGRKYFLRGEVIHGHARGRTIGVPTANIRPDVDFIPRLGVYVSEVEFKGQLHPSITNVGVNPTFEKDGPLRVETHLLDFSADLYGQEIKVHLLQFVRDEKKFASIDDLITQIKNDLIQARSYFT